jgi:von Willebrand factor type A domain
MHFGRRPLVWNLVSTAFVGLLGCTPQVQPTGGPGASGPGGSSNPNGGIELPETNGMTGMNGSAPPAAGSEPSANNNCGVKKINLERQPADLLLVLDRSRSMNQSPTGGRGGSATPVMGAKWTEVVAALDPVVMRTEQQVSWGLKLFPLGDQCGVPEGATVPVAAANYDEVMAAIRSNDPGAGTAGSTPTRVAVEKATAHMKASPSTNAKYLVLATDGLPNCSGRGDRDGNDETGAINAVAQATAAGITTFVVGVATSGSDAHDTLNAMAEKGGHARNNETKYYPVASRDELVSALELITGQVASCTFPLGEAPPVPDNVAVEVDGTRIAHDTSEKDGWNYGAERRTVILHGPICEKLKSREAKNVQILYGCPGVSIQ